MFYSPEKIHRVIVKVSGEVFAGGKSFGYDNEVLIRIAEDIIQVRRDGLSLGLVLGGGNIYRGGQAEAEVRRVTADHIGMLATVQNALVLAEYLRNRNYHADIYSAVQMDKVAMFYTHDRAEKSLREGKICIFCAGTGNPYFTTDTAAVLRATELGANLVLKGTKVDGVYSDDPVTNPDAEFIPEITYDEVLARKLQVMDMTAFSLARDYGIPLKVFNLNQPGSLQKAIMSKTMGTFIHP